MKYPYIKTFNSLSSAIHKIKIKILLLFVLKMEDYNNEHDFHTWLV